MVEDKDFGWRHIVEQLNIADGSYSEIGVHQGEKRENEKGEVEFSEMVVSAAANEFGTRRIPERSFLRATFDEERNNINRLQVRAMNRIYQGSTVRRELPIIGLYFNSKGNG